MICNRWIFNDIDYHDDDDDFCDYYNVYCKNSLQFMDSATEGVLLVSFGSVLQGSQVGLSLNQNIYLCLVSFPPISNLVVQVPQDKLAALLEAFGRLKEKVLFKWETDNLPGICISDNPPECFRKQFCFFTRQACQCAS